MARKEAGRPKGRSYINGIEGFWSYAKHWLYPYRGVPRKFFHIYLGEISFRFLNPAFEKDSHIMEAALAGRRLLTGY
ncbi:MAG TPA: hypothetical protein PLR20_06470 [Syntrophales bacterium]|nr:hypothetical protein [Syntrophales bacterium]HPI56160.1 hypothetical protein [Syntrophales bacterium]HPN24348.1 hypothetical protein [Syntrophales bacterium]HQM28978.1 hypothetical protein [Syntrophales bacterium]